MTMTDSGMTGTRRRPALDLMEKLAAGVVAALEWEIVKQQFRAAQLAAKRQRQAAQLTAIREAVAEALRRALRVGARRPPAQDLAKWWEQNSERIAAGVEKKLRRERSRG